MNLARINDIYVTLGALNLMGAMRGAKIVAAELHGLMWQWEKEPKAATRDEAARDEGARRQRAPTWNNPFEMPYGTSEDDGGETASDDDDASLE